MPILVLGDSPQAWLVAAVASATSGEPVPLVAPMLPAGTTELDLRTPERRVDSRIVTSSRLGRDLDRAVVIVASEIQQGRDLASAYLTDLVDRIVLLAPSGPGGSVVVARLFEAAGLSSPTIAETTGFPVLGRLRNGVAEVSAIKRGLPIAALQAGETERVVAAIAPYLPWVVEAESILATSLANTNNIVHPPLALLNAMRIDAGTSFRFYREGLTPAGSRLIEAVDAERLAITDRLGLAHLSVADWFSRFYRHQGMSGSDVGEMLRTFVPFADSQGPTQLRHRYLVDDIGSGLAVIEAIGHRLGFEMPVIGSICTIGGQLVQLDLRVGAAALAALLLQDLSFVRDPLGPERSVHACT